MTRLKSDIERLTDRSGPLKARDGAIIDVTVDEANGIQWFFKYHKNANVRYKWWAMGRQEPMWRQDGAITPTPTNTWVYQPSGLVIPLPGMYRFGLGVATGSTATAQLLAGAAVDAGVPPTWGIFVFPTNVTFGFEWESQTTLELAAGHTIQAAFQTNVLGPIVNSNTLRVSPARVQI